MDQQTTLQLPGKPEGSQTTARPSHDDFEKHGQDAQTPRAETGTSQMVSSRVPNLEAEPSATNRRGLRNRVKAFFRQNKRRIPAWARSFGRRVRAYKREHRKNSTTSANDTVQTPATPGMDSHPTTPDSPTINPEGTGSAAQPEGHTSKALENAAGPSGAITYLMRPVVAHQMSGDDSKFHWGRNTPESSSANSHRPPVAPDSMDFRGVGGGAGEIPGRGSTERDDISISEYATSSA
ncbi:hypothetical protein BT63DRAFT_417338 [Microthyrium microscopicum]|uniref:Uncharacterized protein n=1 Tax=Microthyrium microscopicum TaxID=703497 RepID=A0A6A6U3H8_9PEZI|nr:hypothetical protein BT63DRAFT_417338 [Microthyrium microscopicum]